jgi:hypothetical protein
MAGLRGHCLSLGHLHRPICILHRPPTELLMTGVSLGRGCREIPSHSWARALALTRSANSHSGRVRTWATRSPPQTKIDTHLGGKWGNGPDRAVGAGVECHAAGPCGPSFLRVLINRFSAGMGTCHQALLITLSLWNPETQLRVWV